MKKLKKKKGPSAYAQKGQPARLSEEFQRFFEATQAGSKTSADADFWRRAHSKRFPPLMLHDLRIKEIHYTNCTTKRRG